MLLVLLLVAWLLAGCTGDQAAPGLPVPPGPAPLVAVDPGNLPAEVIRIRYTGFDERGRVVLGPLTLDRQPQKPEADNRLVTLQLETLDHQSGTVHVEAYGRPVPSPYAAPPPQPQATLREKFKL